MQSQKHRFLPLALLLVAIFAYAGNAAVLEMVPGDADYNGITNISDAVYLIAYIFGSGPPPLNFCSSDVTDDCLINVSDAVELISYIFEPGYDPLVLGCPHQEFSSGCLTYAGASRKADLGYRHAAGASFFDPPEDSTEYMYLEITGDDLHVWHINAYYDCCLRYATEVEWLDYRHLAVQESDTGTPCDSFCYFNLETVIPDLMIMEPTTYVVTLLGIYGDTVGVDSITIGGNGYMYAEALENDLHIYHLNAYYNCCLGYVVDYEINGFEITAAEVDTGPPCDCICFFNLETVLYDLEDGEYLVRLIGIAGDTVGIDTVTVPGGAELIGYEADGCLGGLAFSDPPEISYSYVGGILYFLHQNAYFNCVAELVVEFEQAGDTLRLYELNVATEFVYCMCYFDITAEIAGLPPGSYIAEVYEKQYPDSDIELVDRRTILLE